MGLVGLFIRREFSFPIFSLANSSLDTTTGRALYRKTTYLKDGNLPVNFGVGGIAGAGIKIMALNSQALEEFNFKSNVKNLETKIKDVYTEPIVNFGSEKEYNQLKNLLRVATLLCFL